MISKVTSAEQLRERAEEALEEASPRAEALLVRLANHKEASADHRVFAHRHLAELNLEDHPWRAALHLRHAMALRTDDDVLFALNGLCHALLGNFNLAVKSYRKAANISPNTPWYHHNLGHLMDIALGDARGAERHLRRAHALEPDHDEILASLAHCLASLGRREEALRFAQLAFEQSPHSTDHEELLAWINEQLATELTDSAGAAVNDTELRASHRTRRTSDMQVRAPRQSQFVIGAACHTADQQLDRAVLACVTAHMRDAGYAGVHVERAKQIWVDAQTMHDPRLTERVRKPEVVAAALEYAVSRLYGVSRGSLADLARRYEVAPGSVRHRYAQLREALALRPDSAGWMDRVRT